MELLVALVIFGVVIAAGFTSIQQGTVLIENARDYTRASQVMQSEIERLRSMAWATLDALPASEEVDLAERFDASRFFSKYTMQRTVSGSGTSRRIRVTLSWTNSRGREYSRTYVTDYAQGGLYDYFK